MLAGGILQCPCLSAGYDLNFAKLEATWAEHCPAYFVATHSQVRLGILKDNPLAENAVHDPLP